MMHFVMRHKVGATRNMNSSSLGIAAISPFRLLLATADNLCLSEVMGDLPLGSQTLQPASPL